MANISNHRTSKEKATGCPKCAARIRNDIIAKENAKLNNMAEQYPHLAEQWHPTKNGDLKVTEVSVHSNKKVWWICEKGHEWKAIVTSRNRGYGCPMCNRLQK